ncbi:sialidase family protein [Zhouia amylolytica]|uniref:Sortilin N-terminal domain-containing protein n=1 Tax=Zhouia amylolytica AD3 TaxID=1286632 RepID=W2UJK3_9FLAO|nr:sialidase family protein [Zhouia amylolytica]ETN94149.1 hypothetical protein P278_29530 [Zhouia amylolytica AD3]
MKKHILLAGIISAFNLIQAQQPPTAPDLVEKSVSDHENMREKSIVKNLPFTSIGPTIMSGRVVDLDVNPNDPTEFYVGYASGGVWHTNNNGTSFTSIMDQAPTQNIGDIAVDWKNGTIWVGTGENNSSRSSYAGIGVLKTTDQGKTWKNVGLNDSHHIGRIIINPTNPNEVIIGVTGHLYSKNSERGVYKTSDGGLTWKKTLYINDETGIIDLVHSPDNFNVMYAAAWERDRKAWNFTGSGDNSGIYKSTDGGDSWSLITSKNSGFPTGEGVGRIGLAVYDDNTLFAVHDSQFHREKKDDTSDSSDKLTKDDFKSMPTEEFMKLDNKKLNEFLKTNGFHEKYRAQNVKQLVSTGTVKPNDLAKYLEDANALLFDTPVKGAEVYKSTDGGKSWHKTHEEYIDGLFYSYGYYFGEIRVDPSNANKLYIGGVPLVKSDDGGKNWKIISKENVHADHQALWINPNKSGHLINGNDGGVNISYDDGEHWIKNNTPAVGQFYAVNIDHQKPYNIYGGLQDNGVWTAPHNARQDQSWKQYGSYPWKELMGGDGMQVQIDNRNHNIIYTGYQFGNYYRIDQEKNKRVYIQPKHELGESPYRFNWQTPILLSPHNQDILYLGGNKLMRSMNQGNDWTAISEDLTNGGKPGNVAYGTLTTISESPFEFGLIYTGSDDGMIHVTKNAGASWEVISSNLPKDLWVSRVIASSHKKERVYVTLNGYRWDDFNTYVYMSDDYGKNWKDISSNLPISPVNVIREDPTNQDLLYLGTDNGLFVSLNSGNSWEAFGKNLPMVAVHDLVIQPEAKDLVVGTHGRSIYIADIAQLQQLTGNSMTQEVILFDINDIRHSTRWGNKWNQWSETYEPHITIPFYVSSSKQLKANVVTTNNIVVNSLALDADQGLNYKKFDLTFSDNGRKAYAKKNKNANLKKAANGKYYLPKGTYKIIAGTKEKQFTVK